MRIIAGKAKGLRLKAPKGYATRPTADRVKEAMFNVIQGRETGALVLDLFAGTGALGLEALSRGAGKAVFVETNPVTRQVLAANIAKAGMAAQATVVKMDALSFLRSYEGGAFDLIFMDPPYDYDNEISVQVLDAIAEKQLLSPGGLIIWERSNRNPSFQPVSGFKLVKEKHYGDTVLLFIEQIKEE
ncbi:MAG: 16S rRNA (guanine(966)-N(2))-methyltransferase RsmD [Clostridia bacterium]|nr:16S rRNA (guanine(966)-N(2))-methyltransferase RsmD [Clostridia bacterium]